jgi:tRNA threonylcarbamoyladenosine biosynthesis protein TsaE
MTFEKKIYIENIEQLKLFAEKLAKFIKMGDVITFVGNLGAGKTTLIREIIHSLLSDDNVEVTSPSFNLLHVYNLDNITISHFDLYRLKNLTEAYELGIEDAFFSSVSLIEWPEIIGDILPNDKLEIQLSFVNNSQTGRELTLKGDSKWKNILEGLGNAR